MEGSLEPTYIRCNTGILDSPCARCGGLGVVPAMQSMATYDAGSIRGPNTWVKCPRCKGKGFLKGA